MHLGHQALLARLKERARHYRVPSVVYTFDPPTRVLTQGVEFLSTLPEKLDLLTRYGIDEVIAVPFTTEFASRPKEAFLDDLRTLRPRALVIGEDFHFGKGRAGGLADLKTVCADVVALPMHSLGEQDIKSTRIREMLRLGDVEGAARFLGRHYDAQGVVVQGDQLGRTIGYPTANIRVPDGKALPLGVFAAKTITEQGSFGGMANVGYRPTVNGKELRFEVNLFDFQRRPVRTGSAGEVLGLPARRAALWRSGRTESATRTGRPECAGAAGVSSWRKAMCNHLFLASDRPLPELPWKEQAPGLYVWPILPPERNAAEWLTLPYIYGVGIQEGCGCPFVFEPDWNAPSEDDLREFQRNRPNFTQLAAYLAEALQQGAQLELYNAEEFWLLPLTSATLQTHALLAARFVFDERQFFRVVAPHDK